MVNVSPKFAIKMLRRNAKKTVKDIAAGTELKKEANVAAAIRSGADMKLSSFQQIVNYLGYDIVLKPILSGDPDEMIVIDCKLPDVAPGLLKK